MTSYYAADVLQFFADNWVWLLCGWLGLSVVLTPLIGLFCATNRRDDELSAAEVNRLRLEAALIEASSDPVPRDTVFGYGTFNNGIFIPTERD